MIGTFKLPGSHWLGFGFFGLVPIPKPPKPILKADICFRCPHSHRHLWGPPAIHPRLTRTNKEWLIKLSFLNSLQGLWVATPMYSSWCIPSGPLSFIGRQYTHIFIYIYIYIYISCLCSCCLQMYLFISCVGSPNKRLQTVCLPLTWSSRKV